MRTLIRTAVAAVFLTAALVVIAQPAFADAPPAEVYQETIPVQEPAPIAEVGSCWTHTLTGVVPLYFFDEEDNDVGGGLHWDFRCSDNPISFGVGFEASHIDLDQDAALGNAEFPGKEVNVSFFRIPFAIEYYHAINENWDFFIGGGPDIIHTANDVSDTSLGFHASARLAYNINEHWGLSVEGGYFWAEVKDGGEDDISLDSAFILPGVYYKF